MTFYMCKVDFDMMLGRCRSDFKEGDPFHIFRSQEEVQDYCGESDYVKTCGVVEVELNYTRDVIPQSENYPCEAMGYKKE